MNRIERPSVGAPATPVPRGSMPPGYGAAESAPALVRGLAALAAARDRADAGDAAVAAARELTGARGAAVGLQRGGRVVILACSGYDCDTMSPGSALPLDAGLPLTECVRTGHTVVRGLDEGAGWVAVPVVTASERGALLVSLRPGARPDVRALETLGTATAGALARCPLAGGAPPPLAEPPNVVLSAPGWLSAAAQCVPAVGSVGGAGDTVVVSAGHRESVAWVVVGDACGTGGEAAAAGSAFLTAVQALVAADLTPAEVLAATHRALQREPSVDRFVTAVAVRLDRTDTGAAVSVASAGHPPVLLSVRGALQAPELPGLPLNLFDEPQLAVAQFELASGDTFVAYTDGLVDRGVDDRTDALTDLFGRATGLADPAAVVDAVLVGLEHTTGPARDDVALAVASLR